MAELLSLVCHENQTSWSAAQPMTACQFYVNLELSPKVLMNCQNNIACKNWNTSKSDLWPNVKEKFNQSESSGAVNRFTWVFQ